MKEINKTKISFVVPCYNEEGNVKIGSQNHNSF